MYPTCFDASSALRAIDQSALERHRQDAVAAAPNVIRLGWAARPPRVLVIEDHVDSAEALVFVLQTMGFEAAAVHDGGVALAEALSWQPTLILSDIDLPHRDGYQLARDFRAHPAFAHTPLIALSGRALPDERGRAAAAGFERLLAKPIEPEALRAALCAQLDRRRQRVAFLGPERRLH